MSDALYKYMDGTLKSSDIAPTKILIAVWTANIVGAIVGSVIPNRGYWNWSLCPAAALMFVLVLLQRVREFVRETKIEAKKVKQMNSTEDIEAAEMGCVGAEEEVQSDTTSDEESSEAVSADLSDADVAKMNPDEASSLAATEGKVSHNTPVTTPLSGLKRESF